MNQTSPHSLIKSPWCAIIEKSLFIIFYLRNSTKNCLDEGATYILYFERKIFHREDNVKHSQDVLL